jgi:UDP-glucose 4-epimerase
VGPRQTGRYGMVIPNFVQQALTGQDITVYGDGTQTRCFTHVSDVIEALIAIAEHPQAVGEVYNIGSDHEISMLELAERIKNLTGSASSIVFVPYDQAYESGFEDMMRRVPDITKIRQLIGYKPKVDLDGLLASIIDFHRVKMLGELGIPASSLVFQSRESLAN